MVLKIPSMSLFSLSFLSALLPRFQPSPFSLIRLFSSHSLPPPPSPPHTRTRRSAPSRSPSHRQSPTRSQNTSGRGGPRDQVSDPSPGSRPSRGGVNYSAHEVPPRPPPEGPHAVRAVLSSYAFCSRSCAGPPPFCTRHRTTPRHCQPTFRAAPPTLSSAPPCPPCHPG